MVNNERENDEYLEGFAGDEKSDDKADDIENYSSGEIDLGLPDLSMSDEIEDEK